MKAPTQAEYNKQGIRLMPSQINDLYNQISELKAKLAKERVISGLLAKKVQARGVQIADLKHRLGEEESKSLELSALLGRLGYNLKGDKVY